ncbi:chromatin remodelling complex Rsc7/Swp82 subunit-domain-containing protein [Peziza echinospora]|nr:chromatin remodelling complex Rsc7/Swp82 subunit-domain-containing protein [Peziza echinospora]
MGRPRKAYQQAQAPVTPPPPAEEDIEPISPAEFEDGDEEGGEGDDNEGDEDIDDEDGEGDGQEGDEGEDDEEEEEEEDGAAPTAAQRSTTSSPPGTAGDSSKPESSIAGSDVDRPALEIPSTPAVVKRKRGRPPRSAMASSSGPGGGTPSTPAARDTTPASATAPSTPQPPQSTSKKRRGRPPVRQSSALKSRGGPSHVTAVPLDKEGNPQTVLHDEIVLTPDPAGEQKVTPLGQLLGGREYRCRTFTIKGRGTRLYMLSTEPARCIGFRDSYLFFQKHKQLFKIIMDDDEKYDMIARNLIPHSYKGRAIGVVTARSVFREFGARIIVGGRKVIDDYWEAREREAGAVEGELADPEDKIPPGGIKEYNRNQYVAWHGASSVYHTGQPSVPLQMQSERHQGRMRDKLLFGGTPATITDENWMLEHARSASIFNSDLLAERTTVSTYEPHTNIMFTPSATQPRYFKWEKIPNKPVPSGHVVVETNMLTPVFSADAGAVGLGGGYPYLNNPYGGVGMADVSEELVEVLAAQFGKEMGEKVRRQAGLERAWEERWTRK